MGTILDGPRTKPSQQTSATSSRSREQQCEQMSARVSRNEDSFDSPHTNTIFLRSSLQNLYLANYNWHIEKRETICSTRKAMRVPTKTATYIHVGRRVRHFATPDQPSLFLHTLWRGRIALIVDDKNSVCLVH